MQRVISVIDITHFQESKELLAQNDPQAFDRLLFDIGFDINKDIEYQLCLHRPMVFMAANKNPVLSGRWVGTERRDEAWLNSGYCTYENELEMIGIKDIGFQRELTAMNRRPNFTAMICDYVRENSVGGK